MIIDIRLYHVITIVVSDPGEAFADATCTGGTLTTYLRSTKVLDLEDVQWAVNTLADWPNSHSMSTCGSECQLSPDRLTVSVTYPNSASGQSKRLTIHYSKH